MNQQAKSIVKLFGRRERAIAITGGKGGIGKSTLALNLALSYSKNGSDTLLVDADFGMADLNLLLGVAPEHSLLDILQGASADDVLVKAHGIHLLPALSGVDELASMGDEFRESAFAAIESMSSKFSTLVIDVAAGAGEATTAFAGAVPDTVVVVTPESLSLADAYATLKILSNQHQLTHAYIVPNQVRDQAEAESVFQRLYRVVNRFLDIQLIRLPAIPFDRNVSRAIDSGIPLLSLSPDAPASRQIRKVARRLDAIAVPDRRRGITRLWWKNTFKAVSERHV